MPTVSTVLQSAGAAQSEAVPQDCQLNNHSGSDSGVGRMEFSLPSLVKPGDDAVGETPMETPDAGE